MREVFENGIPSFKKPEHYSNKEPNQILSILLKGVNRGAELLILLSCEI